MDLNTEFGKTKNNVWVFGKWLIISIIVGIIVGLVSVAFHSLTEYANDLRHEYSWLIFLLPIGGVVIAFMYKSTGMDKDKGTNAVLNAVRSKEVVAFKTAPLIFVSTIITHLFGGSSGREGAALQLGASLSGTIGRVFKLNEYDMKIITVSGMAAGFSALFGTPITAFIFSLEVVNVGVMQYSAIVPSIIASVFGFLVSVWFGAHSNSYILNGIPELTILNVFKIIALGVLCAIVSIIFCLAMKYTSKYYKVYISNKMLRAAVGGIIIMVLTYLCGSFDYNGTGMDIIAKAIAGEAKPEAFILKIIFTALTLCAGFKGGEIVPTMFVGSTFGNVASGLLGLSPSFGAGAGIVAVFCGVTNCPLTSIVLGAELFGIEGIVFFAIISSVSYMLSGYYGLYSSQKIVYKKVKDEDISISL